MNEARVDAVRRMLAGAERRRHDVLLHVPFCAGSDLVGHLLPGRLGWADRMFDAQAVDEAEFAAALAFTARNLGQTGGLLFHGPQALAHYLAVAGHRPGDRLFGVVRAPLDRLASAVNQMMTQLATQPHDLGIAARRMVGRLQLRPAAEIDPMSELRRIVEHAIDHVLAAPPVPICDVLAGAAGADSRTALARIMALDIELTTVDAYEGWLARRFGVRSRLRENISQVFVGRADFAAAAGRFAEDERLVGVIAQAMAAQATSSVRGRSLALRGGVGLLDQPTPPPPPAAGPVVAMGQCVSSALQAPPGDRVAIARAEFGPDGTGRSYLGTGWGTGWGGGPGGGAGDVGAWTVRPCATLHFHRPEVPGAYLLQLLARPFTLPGLIACQRMRVMLGSAVVADATLTQDTLLEIPLPWAGLAAEAVVEIAFILPDAMPWHVLSAAQDDRVLGLGLRSASLWRLGGEDTAQVEDGVRPRPGPTEELMLRFESLGANCEFGMVQRRGGAEPLSLLRFASAPWQRVIQTLQDRFVGLGKPGTVLIHGHDRSREMFVRETSYGFLYHTFVYVGDMTEAALVRREERRLPFLARKLTEDLTEGHKLFVAIWLGGPAWLRAKELAETIAAYGPGALLWVDEADSEHPNGTVEWVGENLLKGYIDRLAPPENVPDLSYDSWLGICLEADRMRRQR